MVTW